MQRNKSVVTNSTIIENLSPYTEYAFQVAAVNFNGTGPFTELITFGGNYCMCGWELYTAYQTVFYNFI